MNWKWAGRMAAVAVATAALTVVAGMQLRVIADETKTEAVTVGTGTLSDCKVDLVAGKAAYNAGEKPELVLKVTGNSSGSEEIEATIIINGTSTASERSRMGPRPVMLWKHSGKFLAMPGETTEYPLTVDLTVPENQSISYKLLLGPQPVAAPKKVEVRAVPSVPAPAPQLAQVVVSSEAVTK